MLDKLSRQILKHMNSAEQPSDTYYNFDEDLDEIAEAIESDSESVRSAVRYLHERELTIKVLTTKSLTGSKQRSVGKNACMVLSLASSFLCWQAS